MSEPTQPTGAQIRGEGPVQHIGNPRGRIAIWCDETEAFDIAAKFPYPDKFSDEIGAAVDRAYPLLDDDDPGLGIRIGFGPNGPTLRVVDLREEAS